MVLGADTLLDILSEGKNNIKLTISNHSDILDVYDKIYELEIENEVDSWDLGGATYYLDEFNLKIWLCYVTLFVFGYYPKNIYICK